MFENLYKINADDEGETTARPKSLYEQIIAPHVTSVTAPDNDLHTVDRLFLKELACRAYKLFTKFSTPDMHETSCIGLIHLDVVMTSNVYSCKPIKQSGAEHGPCETNFLVNEDETVRNCDGDSCKKTCLKGVVFPGMHPEDIMLYYHWRLAHYIEMNTKHYWILSKSLIMPVKLSLEYCLTAQR